MAQITFIPIEYDYFDFQGRNYARVIGRDDKGKRVMMIDSFEPYFWAVLKETSEKRTKEINMDKGDKSKQGSSDCGSGRSSGFGVPHEGLCPVAGGIGHLHERIRIRSPPPFRTKPGKEPQMHTDTHG